MQSNLEVDHTVPQSLRPNDSALPGPASERHMASYGVSGYNKLRIDRKTLTRKSWGSCDSCAAEIILESR